MVDESKPTEPDFSAVTSGSSSTAEEVPPVVPPAPEPRTYTVVPGDTLSKIAKHYYGQANEWSKIFEANKETIKNPDMIKVGQVLTIPE